MASTRKIAFDMGGVLTIDPFAASREYADEVGVPRETFVDLLKGPVFAGVEIGETSMRDFLKHACTDVQERHEVRVDIRRLAEALASGQAVNPAMVSLVEEIANHGISMSVVTNNAREARSWWNSSAFPIDCFEFVLDSSEVGVRKPAPEIFAALIRRAGVEAGDIVFFDDLAENVTGAEVCGLDAVLFIDAEQCRSALLDRGLI
ncbi:HAD family hydrolase [Gordonia terrae]